MKPFHCLINPDYVMAIGDPERDYKGHAIIKRPVEKEDRMGSEFAVHTSWSFRKQCEDKNRKVR